MFKNCILIFFLLFIALAEGQITPVKQAKEFDQQFQESDTTRNIRTKGKKIILSEKTKYTDYKVISYKNDTTYIDTTLSMDKAYKFNYLRKDNFELLPFHNQGQTFNNLGYTFQNVSLFPSMGARALHFNYYDVSDIDYYHVATPTTELMFRSGLEQGQVLDALFTFNSSKRHNTSIAYKGLRSLGKYRSSLSSHGNMRATFNYRTKNDAYNIRSHIVAQDLSNDQNGGITPESIISFETNDSNFTDRGRLETNFTDARSLLRGNRYYIDHDYKIWQRKDSLNNVKTYLKIGNIINYERKHYNFTQDASNSLIGDAFTSSISDRSQYIH